MQLIVGQNSYLYAYHSPYVRFRLPPDHGRDEGSRKYLRMSLFEAGLGNLQVVQCVDKSILQVLGSLPGHWAVWDMPEFGVDFRWELGTHV